MGIFNRPARAERIVKKLYERFNLLFMPCWKFADIEIGRKPVVFLLDSGANMNVISSSFVKRLGLFHNVDFNTEIFGFGIIDCVGKLHNMNFELADNKLFETDFLMVDEIDSLQQVLAKGGYDMVGVLGSSFLEKYGFVLDFNQKSIEYGKCD